MTHQIFQIVYSEKTRLGKDPDFLPLDNLDNSRPDWREYWPIRNFLLNRKLLENQYYGFFSPKFAEKTNLKGTDALALLNNGDEDVVSFSPFFDQTCLFLNPFLQGSSAHPGIREALTQSARLLNPKTNINRLVMDSTNTIYCNYFAAKPKFWRHWLDNCEKIYTEAENNNSTLAKHLNMNVTHDKTLVPAKVFIIERIASLLLSENNYTIRTSNPLSARFGVPKLRQKTEELIQLDAYKIAYRKTGHNHYMILYKKTRDEILKFLKSRPKN